MQFLLFCACYMPCPSYVGGLSHDCMRYRGRCILREGEGVFIPFYRKWISWPSTLGLLSQINLLSTATGRYDARLIINILQYCYMWAYITIYLCLYGHSWTSTNFFSFLIHTQSIGLLGCGISPSQGCNLTKNNLLNNTWFLLCPFCILSSICSQNLHHLFPSVCLQLASQMQSSFSVNEMN